jgi:uncharacterized membrane protein YtjA (UPF0391 family)
MLGWSIMFLIVALIAGLLGFVGIAGTAASIAQVLFVAVAGLLDRGTTKSLNPFTMMTPLNLITERHL